MFLDRYTGYTESLDFSTLPEYKQLTAEQQKLVYDTFSNAYHSSVHHLGQKIALGKAHENAKALIEALHNKPRTIADQPVPPSIFAGLNNCE